ncbi:putative peptidoglycan lipid II flippase [Methylomarinovum caldicuralii]|uniref:Probable lipid II flippase MurJ n=1 Tax=Methylomarinovum caldicuralii TaxID=438856 RepID=A0AAU9C2Y8_9GAMM|nr:murein biosynthesis integral membrane protein MurJ [Methylomarinovum caldicuralii]BCX81489.1 putative peptidoglycan lipid II flippase [Methylomarinovum caldicuralii]
MSRRLFRSTAVVGGMTLISRILGFIRDVVIAYLFGANAATDAFFVAFKIPNFLRRLFAEGAFSQAFVPVMAEYKEQRGQAELKRFLDRTAGSLAMVLMAVTLLGVIGAPWVILVFAPGFSRSGEVYELAVQMLRITFPYLFFIASTAMAGAILNTFNRFAVPAFTPVLLNLCLIASAWWLAPQLPQPIIALAWGVFAAGSLQLLFQFPALWRLKLLPRLRWGFHDPGVRKILKLMLPALFGVSVTQINLLIDTLLASLLPHGSISWLYYSDRLVEFPLGVFGIALATVILPNLSKDWAAGRREDFSRAIDWALRWVVLIGLPAAAGLAVLARPILATLFQYRAFTAHDVHMAGLSLTAYAVGLVGFILVKILVPGFTARQDTRTPVRFGVAAMVVNIVLNLGLIGWLAHAGLALATSLAACVNGGLLLRRLRRLGVYRPGPGWWGLLLRVVVANGVMAACLYYTAREFSWTELSRPELRLVRLILLIGLGVSVYGGSLWLVGLRLRHLQGKHPAFG